MTDIVAMQCAHCGANLNPTMTGQMFKCQYCGSPWIIKNGKLIRWTDPNKPLDTCHYCGAPLGAPDLNDFVHCSYCGMKYWVGNRPKHLDAIASKQYVMVTHHKSRNWAAHIIEIGIALFITAILVPPAITQIETATQTNSTSGWNQGVVTLYQVLLPVMIVIGIVAYFFYQVRGESEVKEGDSVQFYEEGKAEPLDLGNDEEDSDNA